MGTSLIRRSPDQNVAASRAFEARNHPQDRCFAAARGAEQGGEGAFFKDHICAMHGFDRAKRFADVHKFHASHV